jgi:hypothetical protein
VQTQALDYQTAVKLADAALAALLDSVPHIGDRYTRDVRHDMAIAFHYWLTVEHPDVLDALERQAAFEQMMLEEYIHMHSAAYALEESDNPVDDWCIRRRPVYRTGPERPRLASGDE